MGNSKSKANKNSNFKKILEEHQQYLNASELKIRGLYRAYVHRCIDGDTFVCSIKFHNIFLKLNVRLAGIDAFEMKVPQTFNGKIVKNRDQLALKGIEAKNRLTQLIDKKYITLNCEANDKYGRLLASIVAIEGNSINVGQLLINEGHAFEYHGVGEKQRYNYYLTD